MAHLGSSLGYLVGGPVQASRDLGNSEDPSPVVWCRRPTVRVTGRPPILRMPVVSRAMGRTNRREGYVRYRWDVLKAIALALVVSAAIPLSDVQAATTVGLWHMDETSGSAAHDSSGHGNDGKLQNVQFASGAFSFNGHNSRVLIGNSSSLNPGSADITISLKVKFSVKPSHSVHDYDLVRKGNGGTFYKNRRSRWTARRGASSTDRAVTRGSSSGRIWPTGNGTRSPARRRVRGSPARQMGRPARPARISAASRTASRCRWGESRAVRRTCIRA